MVRNLLALIVTLFVLLGGSALGQEFTLDKDQRVADAAYQQIVERILVFSNSRPSAATTTTLA